MKVLQSEYYVQMDAASISAMPHGSSSVVDSLAQYRRDIHSQFGEDGIIEELLRRLGRWDVEPDNPLWCVEFGAWDGIHLSNTRRLIEDRGAQAILIESDEKRFKALRMNCASFSGVIALNRSVGYRGEDALDVILEATPCPDAFDVLSIDIDGLDHLIWTQCKRHHPLIVITEFNPTIPFEHPFAPPSDGSERTGASLCSMRDLGQEKGYTLVAVTEVNAIFVRTADALRAGIASGSISELTEGLQDFRTFMYQTPEGRFEICGNFSVMWHEVCIPPRKLQPLPWWARGHADGGGVIHRLLLGWLRRRNHRQFERFLTARHHQYTPPDQR